MVAKNIQIAKQLDDMMAELEIASKEISQAARANAWTDSNKRALEIEVTIAQNAPHGMTRTTFFF